MTCGVELLLRKIQLSRLPKSYQEVSQKLSNEEV